MMELICATKASRVGCGCGEGGFRVWGLGSPLCNESITCWLGLQGRRAEYGCEQSNVAEHIEVIGAGWLLERDWRLPVGKAAFDLACTSC